MQMRDPASCWLDAFAHLPSNPQAATSPLRRSPRIPQYAQIELQSQLFDSDDHHRLSLCQPAWSCILDPTAAPTLDALILSLERPASTQLREEHYRRRLWSPPPHVAHFQVLQRVFSGIYGKPPGWLIAAVVSSDGSSHAAKSGFDIIRISAKRIRGGCGKEVR